VRPDHPPFFQAGCPRCEAKLAAGLVRGDEGIPPPNWRGLRRPPGRVAQLAMQREARRRLVLGLVPVRVPPVRQQP
jgi:hypothetical protein